MTRLLVEGHNLGGMAMGRGVVALCGVISILLTGCSTIVKGTKQQVSVATPGVQGALCTLSSPAVGTRTVETPGTIVLPNRTKQCYTEGEAYWRRRPTS
jgi:hypothetical protein